MNVLFTCAGRRNYLLHYFKEIIGDSGNTIAVDTDVMAPALSEADIAFTVPSLNHPDYLGAISTIITDYAVDLVIPLNDLELMIMSVNREKLEATGAKVVISRPELISTCADKWKTYRFFKDLKIPTVKTFVELDEVLTALNDNAIDFPLILKPRWGYGSVGIQEVATEKELRMAYPLLLSRFEKTDMESSGSENLHNGVIIQEKAPGEEYGIDILNDFNGKYHGAYAKKKLSMRSGETDRASSVVHQRFLRMAEKIGNATKHVGIMDCDFFLRDDEIYFLEMNPRFGGGYPFTHHAGVNIPGMYLQWLRGNSDVSIYDNYISDCLLTKCQRILPVGNIKAALEKDSEVVIR